jgi:hypothetical protein
LLNKLDAPGGSDPPPVGAAFSFLPEVASYDRGVHRIDKGRHAPE